MRQNEAPPTAEGRLLPNTRCAVTGSVHPSGTRYEWATVQGIETPLAPAPQWLLDLLSKNPAQEAQEGPSEAPQASVPATALATQRTATHEHCGAYVTTPQCCEN